MRVINDKKLNKNRIFIFFEKPIFTKLLIFSLYLITVVVYIDIIIKNGLFSFKALNIYAVYTIRDDFSLHHYIWYLFEWQYLIINPFFIIRFLKKNKKLKAFTFILLQVIAYLYAAQKAILFIIPLIIIIYYFSKLKYFFSLIFSGLTEKKS